MTTLPAPPDGLTVRAWHDDDAAELLAVAADPRMRRWTSLRVDDLPGARRWLSEQHRGWADGTRYSFAVRERDGTLAGLVALKRPDPRARVAEVGYWTAAHARGRGVAPRAVRALTAWAFTRFAELDRLELLHQVDNAASCRVALKSGYALQRTLAPQAPYPREGHLHACARAGAAGTAHLGDRVVHRLGFGSMRLTANPDRDLAVRVLRRAVELGVDHIDTAAFYVSPGGTLGVGTGEKRYATELIRAALSPYPRDLVIATKVGAAAGERPATAAELRTRVEDNLRRLGVEALDVVNLRLKHRDTASLGEQFAVLAQLRQEGLIRHLGISNVRPHHLGEALDIAPVACVQNEYGVDLREAETTTLLHDCARRGIAFVPYFSLAGTGRERGATAGTDTAIRALATAHGVTEQQVRLAWTLHQGPHVLAIPGTGSVEHLEQNVAAAALRLSPAELATV